MIKNLDFQKIQKKIKKKSMFSENTGVPPVFSTFFGIFLDFLKIQVFDLFFEFSRFVSFMACSRRLFSQPSEGPEAGVPKAGIQPHQAEQPTVRLRGHSAAQPRGRAAVLPPSRKAARLRGRMAASAWRDCQELLLWGLPMPELSNQAATLFPNNCKLGLTICFV